MTNQRTAMIVAAPFGGLGMFLAWAALCGAAGLWEWSAGLLVLATVIEMAGG